MIRNKIKGFLGGQIMKWVCTSNGKIAKAMKSKLLEELKKELEDGTLIEDKVTKEVLEQFIAEFEKEKPDLKVLDELSND